eukprot:scaffold36702_cov50-Phaeocystis_antarctica.AAC.1
MERYDVSRVQSLFEPNTSPILHDSAMLGAPNPYLYPSLYLSLQLLDPRLKPALVHAQLLLQGAFLGWVRVRVLGLELGLGEGEDEGWGDASPPPVSPPGAAPGLRLGLGLGLVQAPRLELELAEGLWKVGAGGR